MIDWLISVSSSRAWVLPSCDASSVSASRPGAVGGGPLVLHDTRRRGHGQSQGHRSRQEVQHDSSSDSNIRLWDPSLHHLYNLQGEDYECEYKTRSETLFGGQYVVA